LESKWGRNVFDFGLGSDFATLAARFVGGGDGALLLNKWRGLVPPVLAFVPTDPSVAAYIFAAIPPILEGNFPWGYNVEPAEPP